MDYAELSLLLDLRLDALLSPDRAAHSRRVAALCAALCSREGMEPKRGLVVGLAHDICKQLPKKEQRALAWRYAESRGGLDPASALMADKVVHGPAAAALVERDYGLVDEEALEAIAFHTLGKPGMRPLSVVLYCADKLEPGRARIEPGYREACLALPLAAMLRAVIKGVIGWMEDQGRAVAPETLVLYSSLVGENDPP